MCVACGIPSHVISIPGEPRGEPVVRFAALRNADFRWYFSGASLSMMADNVEHVITYWVLYQTFHSPMLAGFAVISHWLPALFLSVYFGSLADRFDCRKVIQASQGLFMTASFLWGVLFLTNTLQVWNAMVLLVIHGMAGALWSPAEQLMLHDIVGPSQLPSAVRMNSTGRNLGILAGPAAGSVLLLALGPTLGIFANVLIYLPLTLWLLRTPYTGHTHAVAVSVRRPRMSLGDAFRVLREVSGIPVIISMVALGGLSSLLIGSGIQPQMPEFAADLGTTQAGLAYGVLLAANATGAVIGGVLLESTGLLKPNARTAMISTIVWSICMVGFAASQNYFLAIVTLLCAGAANLASQSISQTLVQLLAPPEKRGRVVGVYNMAAQGLRAGSGLSIGVLGAFIGIHWSVAVSASVLLAAVVWLMVYAARASARAMTEATPALQPAWSTATTERR